MVTTHSSSNTNSSPGLLRRFSQPPGDGQFRLDGRRLAILLLILAVTVLAGCGENGITGPGDEPDGETSTAETVQKAGEIADDPVWEWSVSVYAAGFHYPEGPLYMPDGTIYIANVHGTEVNVIQPDSTVGVFREMGTTTNSVTVDREGNLYFTGISAKAILEYTTDGELKTIVTEVDGTPLLSPNDFAWGPGDRLYFTDPKQNSGSPSAVERVCYLDPDGTTHTFVASEIRFPNGLVFNRDRTILYVAHTFTYQIIAYPVNPDGSRGGDMTVLYAFPDGQRPDGMKLDENGNLWVAIANTGEIWCISPQGEKLDSFKTPVNCVTNIAFGGPDNRTAFITGYKGEPLGSDSYVFSVQMPVTGAPLYADEQGPGTYVWER